MVSATVSLTVLTFTALVAQLLLLRELVTFYCGNEHGVALFLSGWLAFSAAGLIAAYRKKTT